MIATNDELSVSRQCHLLEVPRSSYYYQHKPEDAFTLKLMRLIDECHLKHPYYGSRRIVLWLKANHDIQVNRKRVQRLMGKLGIVPLYPKPRTTHPSPEHKVYPYLLRDMTIERPNQVWCADITYIPMEKGYLYLVAIMDWYSRKVLSWRLSNTLDVHFCLEALEEALGQYGTPEIFNTDQGVQFTSSKWIKRLKEAGVRISMDSKGRCVDNIFIERLWRSLKYEEVYLKAYDSVKEAQQGIEQWLMFYNGQRPHQGLNNSTPDEVYAAGSKTEQAA